MIEEVRAELGRYYATITLINLGLGSATFALTWALGMPNPALWGALAGVLNFIPYIGSTSTLLILAIVAVVSFDDIGRILGVTGGWAIHLNPLRRIATAPPSPSW